MTPTQLEAPARHTTHVTLHGGGVRLTDDELPAAGGNVTLVDGCFDPLHAGHMRYFRAAHALGLPLICKSAPDSYIARKHPRAALR